MENDSIVIGGGIGKLVLAFTLFTAAICAGDYYINLHKQYQHRLQTNSVYKQEYLEKEKLRKIEIDKSFEEFMETRAKFVRYGVIR